MIYEEEDGGEDAGEEEEGEAVHQHISSLILVILSLKCRIKPVIYHEEDGGRRGGGGRNGRTPTHK